MAATHKVLFVLFVLNGFILLDHYLELQEVIFSHPHLLGLTYTLPMVIGPLLLLYTLLLIIPQRSISKQFAFHGIPFLILVVYLIFDFYFLSGSEKLAYYHRQTEVSTSFMIYLAEFLLNFSLPVYSVYSIMLLSKHSKQIKNTFSFTEKIDLKWLRIILYLFVSISVIMLFTNLISDVFPIISFLTGDSYIFAALTIAIFFIGYYGIKQKAIYPTTSKHKEETTHTKNSYQKSGLKSSSYEHYLQKLNRLLETEKIYLNARLTLKELADEMQMTENNLSQLINEGLNKTFYQLINEHRVEHFKRSISKSEFQHLSILGVALESGFNSKSSFNSIFKQHTGLTPSQFKKQLDK